MPDYVPADWGVCLKAQAFLRDVLRANGPDSQYFDLQRLLDIGIRPCLQRPVCPHCYHFVYELLHVSKLLYSEMRSGATCTANGKVDMNLMVSLAFTMIHRCPTYTEYASRFREEVQGRILMEEAAQQVAADPISWEVEMTDIIQDGNNIGNPTDVDEPPLGTVGGQQANAPPQQGNNEDQTIPLGEHENSPKPSCPPSRQNGIVTTDYRPRPRRGSDIEMTDR